MSVRGLTGTADFIKGDNVRKMRSKIPSNPLPEYIPSIYSTFYCARHFFPFGVVTSIRDGLFLLSEEARAA
jgi:hypothetical protein